MWEAPPVKITIVGAGYVGATTAFTLMHSGLVSDLVLLDINRARAEGEAMDLSHAASLGFPLRISAGEVADTRNSVIIIFAAGANQKPGETRLDLVHHNVEIVRQALPPVLEHSPGAIVLMVTNPVDVLTYVAWKISGLPPSRVFGSGTVLDSARFRHLLANYLRLDPRNIHAYVIGEHGDTEVPVWSRANVAGVELENYFLQNGPPHPLAVKEEINRQVKEAAYAIIERKGATAYGVAVALRRICEAVLRDENAVLSVSGLVWGIYGIEEDVCLSLPSVVNRGGRDRVVVIPLDSQERAALQHSARTLNQVLRQVGF